MEDSNEDAKFCPYCNSPLSEDNYCFNCGKVIRDKELKKLYYLSNFWNIGLILSLLATPISSINLFMDFGVYPLRLRPEIVGILGSSHPETAPLSTSDKSFLLLITV